LLATTDAAVAASKIPVRVASSQNAAVDVARVTLEAQVDERLDPAGEDARKDPSLRSAELVG